MKKNLLLFLITLFCITFANAQTEKNENNTYLSNEEVFKQAEFVFEGCYLKCVYTYNPLETLKNEDTYAIYSYHVLKVYKGNPDLEGGIIYRTYKGAILGEENNMIFDYLEEIVITTPFLEENGIPGITSRSTAIFFFVPSDFPDDENSKYSQYEKYKPIEKNGRLENNVFYDRLYVSDDHNKFAGLYNLAFKNREDLYQYMKQFEGYRVKNEKIILSR